MLSPARAAAFDILSLVEKGGYAADLLYHRTAGLESRDAGLAEAIVLGSLRVQAQLDFLIDRFSGRPGLKLDPEVRIALRMGLYQLRYLTRVPSHAAVSASVDLVKRARKRSAAPMVNAVLRKVTREPVAWPCADVELSHPGWLLDRWERQFGKEMADSIARANLETPETYVRTSASGETRIQDIGAQAIVPLLDLISGQTFLDLCAAPGNKTVQALEYGVHTVACEIHLSRALPLKALGCPVVVLDGRMPLPFRCPFDRILVDAPCSGTGTLARNPEIKWRLRPERLAELGEAQASLLRNALERLAPGGRLVYSTCSLEREENEDVVDRVMAEVKAVRLERLWRRLPGRDPGDGFFAAVLTSD